MSSLFHLLLDGGGGSLGGRKLLLRLALLENGFWDTVKKNELYAQRSHPGGSQARKEEGRGGQAHSILNHELNQS